MPAVPSFHWNDLRCFLEIARTGRLVEAARRLGQDHSTVSRRLRALEDSLGVGLFERESGGYRLTPTGRTLLTVAEEAEAAALSVGPAIRSPTDGLEGSVVVGAPASLGSYFLAQSLGRLAEELPNVEVTLMAYPRIFNVVRRDVDLAVTLHRPSQASVSAQQLSDFDLHIYASRIFLQATPVASEEDLLAAPFIAYSDADTLSPELHFPKRIHPDVTIRHRISSVTAQLVATQAGLGLCVLPDFVAATAPDLVQVLPRITFKRTIWLIAAKGPGKLPHISAVRDFIAREVERRRSELRPTWTGE